ncbi:hypothetical protein L840_3080 [Mycobacterium sp. MAC_011194_8550]|nr:hypothetical protein L840_3080 [Mycobacterium sp. MAC_011194_8550]
MYEGVVEVVEETVDEPPVGRVNATTRAAPPSRTATAAKATAGHVLERDG